MTRIINYPIKNGQQAVNDLANQLMKQASDRLDDRLDSYLNFTRSLKILVSNNGELVIPPAQINLLGLI